jgi:hypothetical protein
MFPSGCSGSEKNKQENALTTAASSIPAPVDLKADALSKIKLDFTWSTDDVIMTANFVVKNEGDRGIKDFEITCNHTAKSGSLIDSNTRTIYDIVKAHSTKRFPNFNMGFIHAQAAQSSCRVVNLTVIP